LGIEGDTKEVININKDVFVIVDIVLYAGTHPYIRVPTTSDIADKV
jgi:hypothetical protein